jgi:ornithine cyclodeaminase/alanine dehydrogenase
LTLVLSERDVEAILDMREVVAAVEEAFRREATGEVTNSARTRSSSPGSVLNVMHAALHHLGRGGLKAYMASPAGAKFVVILFDASTSAPLAIMGADMLGRFRTGAASGVATKFLYGRPSATLALFGSGKQALTQVMAISAVMSIEEINVWSPDKARREAFARRLVGLGFSASGFPSVEGAAGGAQVGCTITSSREPFLTSAMLKGLAHFNLVGSNNPENAEITPDAVGSFDTVAVDDLPQAKVEYGDLIQASRAGMFSWDRAAELKDFVAGKSRPRGRTLFKSGGAALEDVAVASMLYEKAMNSGHKYPNVDLS